MKEDDEMVNRFDMTRRLLDMDMKYRIQNHLSLNGEVWAACLIGWMLVPLVGGFALNTSIATALGAAIYYGREYIHEQSNYRLTEWMMENRVESMKQHNLLNEEECQEVIDTIHSLKPHDISGYIKYIREMLSKVYASAISPVSYEVNEERVRQNRYLKKIEKEYQVWRVEQGLEPGSTYF